MMPYFFASEASYVAFEVSEQLYLFFRLFRLLTLDLHLRLSPASLLHLHHQVRSLRPTRLIGSQNLIQMHRRSRGRPSLKRIITHNHMKTNPSMGQFLEQLLDEHQFFLLGQFELIAHCYNIPLICLRTLKIKWAVSHRAVEVKTSEGVLRAVRLQTIRKKREGRDLASLS